MRLSNTSAAEDFSPLWHELLTECWPQEALLRPAGQLREMQSTLTLEPSVSPECAFAFRPAPADAVNEQICEDSRLTENEPAFPLEKQPQLRTEILEPANADFAEAETAAAENNIELKTAAAASGSLQKTAPQKLEKAPEDRALRSENSDEEADALELHPP